MKEPESPAAPVAQGGARRPPAWVVFVSFFVLFVLGSHGYVENSDAEVEYQTARAMALRGGPGLSAAHPDASVAEAYIARNELNAMSGVGQDQVPEGERVVYSWFGFGHALTMVPFYGVGQGVAALLPGVERRAADAWAEKPENVWRFGTRDEFWARFFVSLHSPFFAALSVLVLWLLLQGLGYSSRLSLLAATLAALTTQFWPETRESMADTTAGFFLLFAFERAVAWRRSGAAWRLALAGALGGFAVLCRVFHLLPLVAIGLYLLVPLLRERRVREIVPFVLAALPFAVFLLAFNYARFGSVLENGYTAGTADGYWNFPFLHGFVLLALSYGKGVFLFSPLLAAACYGAWRLGKRCPAEALVLASFLVLPWILNSFTTGWHSSQAWACRYLTLGAFALVGAGAAELLQRARAKRRRAWLVWALAGLGFFFNLGGVLTPYRGYYELAFQAIAQRWPQVPAGDRIQYLVAEPRMSPLHAHWSYLLEDLRGNLDAADPKTGALVYRRVFGTELVAPARPSWPEDHGMRHLWPVGVAARLDSKVPWIAALLLLVPWIWTSRRIVLHLATAEDEACR